MTQNKPPPCVEHVIRRLKMFRILKEVYRHRRRRFSLRVHLIAALCNLTCNTQADFCRRSIDGLFLAAHT
ncbi:hypothetical protein [Deinococcus alpinitundrae]|uniref:hypothetical protein n=1 Tax=Deinococcus alpinitundrae TaxID=468913 RepID=UPI003F67E091